MNAKTETALAAEAAAEQATPSTRKEAAGIVKRSSAFYADPRTITPKLKADGTRLNKRFDFGDIEELAASIKANGLLMPLRVKRIAPTVLEDGKGPEGGQIKNFELIDGERRLTAIQLILKKDPSAFPDGVLIIIVDKDQNDVTSLIQMYVANGAKNFTPIEEAHAFKDMKDSGMTIKQICAATGKAHMHVTEILALLDGDETLVEAATKGTIGKTMAKTLARFGKDKDTQAKLTKAAVEAGKDKGKLNQVKKAIQEARTTKAAAKGRTLKIRALDDAALSTLGAKLAATMTDKMKDAGKPLDFNLRDWVKKDEALALAAAFGALEALKAAAGAKVNLDF